MKFDNALYAIRKSMDKIFFGDGEYISGKFARIYGESDEKKRTEKFKKSVLKRYAALVLIFIIILAINEVSEKENSAKQFISEQGGKTTVERPEQGEAPVYMDMKMKIRQDDGETVVRDIQISIEAVNSREVSGYPLEADPESGKEEEMERNIRTAISSINEDVSCRSVSLPDCLADGASVTWEYRETSSTPVMIMIFVFVLTVLYKARFKDIDKEEKAARECIIHELPDFINNLVLLLNAGEVVTTAFMTIMENKRKRAEMTDNYFYSQMQIIAVKIETANGSLYKELEEFSGRSGVRELIRISNILNDNMRLGSDLAEKLTKESEILWFERKKLAEERGRVAETKMTIPLVILLLVLVLITIAPAMLEM